MIPEDGARRIRNRSGISMAGTNRQHRIIACIFYAKRRICLKYPTAQDYCVMDIPACLRSCSGPLAS